MLEVGVFAKISLTPLRTVKINNSLIYVMVGWFARNGTTCVPKSVLRYVVDKVNKSLSQKEKKDAKRQKWFENSQKIILSSFCVRKHLNACQNTQQIVVGHFLQSAKFSFMLRSLIRLNVSITFDRFQCFSFSFRCFFDFSFFLDFFCIRLTSASFS